MKKMLACLMFCLFSTTTFAGLVDYQNTISSPTDGGAGPAIWYGTSRTDIKGSLGSTYWLGSDMNVPSADFWDNANSAFGITNSATTGARIGNSTGLMSGSNGTISFMFKTPGTLSGLESLINQGRYGDSSQFEIAVNDSSLQLKTTLESSRPTTTIGTLQTDTWYYMAVSWDLSKPSDELSWYYAEAGSETLNSGALTIISSGAADELIFVGGRDTGGYEFVDGAFQNLAIYDRTLSASAIESQFSAIPEPATLSLLVVATGGITLLRKMSHQ